MRLGVAVRNSNKALRMPSRSRSALYGWMAMVSYVTFGAGKAADMRVAILLVFRDMYFRAA
jgi:hypothetical protein